MTDTKREQDSKDAFFGRIATLSDEMIAAHGKDFTVGAFVLAARFIADDKMAPPRPAETPHPARKS